MTISRCVGGGGKELVELSFLAIRFIVVGVGRGAPAPLVAPLERDIRIPRRPIHCSRFRLSLRNRYLSPYNKNTAAAAGNEKKKKWKKLLTRKAAARSAKLRPRWLRSARAEGPTKAAAMLRALRTDDKEAAEENSERLKHLYAHALTALPT